MIIDQFQISRTSTNDVDVLLFVMKFDKCHGLGNDYIYVDAAELSFKEASKLAPFICPRGPGVGSDGIILVGRLSENSVSMEMLNADGGEGKMCGNGLRCVVHLARKWGWVTTDEVVVETAAGRRVAYIEEYTDRESQVRVEMGFPVFGATAIGCDRNDPILLPGPSGTWVFHAVSMGNPHVVSYMEGLDIRQFDFDYWGPRIANNPIFPGSVNVNFLFYLGENELLSRIWERGSGKTYACGSGACAGFVVARRLGLVQNKATVALPLGKLKMVWDDSKGVLMTGPATHVYKGELTL